MNDNQVVCIKCGVSVGKGNGYCANCGKQVDANATICVSCGCKLNSTNSCANKIGEDKFRKITRRFLIASICIAALTTIFLLIPHYTFLYSHYSYNTWYYSFVEWMEGMSAVVLLLLWANPVIGLIGLKQGKRYSLIKLINALVLFGLVFGMSIDAGDGLGSMFILTILVLFAQIVVSIFEVIFTLVSNVKAPSKTSDTVMAVPPKEFSIEKRYIFCKNCGVEMNTNQAICIKCGVSVGDGKLYCANCGSAISENAEFCLHCGVEVKGTKHTGQKASAAYLNGQDKITIALLCFCLGGWGIHHFIMGEKKKGITKILLCFACGISSIFALIDFVKILTDNYEVNFESCF